MNMVETLKEAGEVMGYSVNINRVSAKQVKIKKVSISVSNQGSEIVMKMRAKELNQHMLCTLSA